MPNSPESLRALDLIRGFAATHDIEAEDGSRPGEIVLTLPGDAKLRTSCSLLVGGRMLSLSAFVIRRPEENAPAVHEFLLRRNLTTPALSYALDEAGDVYLTGQVPLSAVCEEYLDQLLGLVVTGTDDVFDELLVMGFLGSMRKEWNYRTRREESLANLEKFRAMLAAEEAEDDRVITHETSAEEDGVADGLIGGAGDAN